MTRLTYGPHPDQFLDVGVPGRPGPLPVAVVIHGGFWRPEFRLDLMEGICADLVARGWAAANLEYRRVGTGGGMPETLEDVSAAVDMLSETDADLDLHRVVAIGHSAGGQLALWLASRDAADARVRVAGAVGQGAVCDLVLAAEQDLGDGAAARFCGGTPSQTPAAYAAASPVARLPTGVPTLLVHGARDDRVPVSQAERYAQRARAAGDACELVVHDRDGHFEHIDPSTAAWASVVAWLERRGWSARPVAAPSDA